ncbi:hypothetical protein HY523_02130 [Candidatus Berkelbacteria bacterium]|nr:hypothetical protein [Candidatus Berkelbacteria bacterium]
MKRSAKVALAASSFTFGVLLAIPAISAAHDQPQRSEAVHSKIEAALEAGDYQAWQEIHASVSDSDKETKKPALSEEQFQDLRTFHQLMKEGKYEEARQFAKDHALPIKKMKKFHRNHKDGHPHTDGHREKPVEQSAL